ncbi:MAG: hypothetical protein LH631_08735 [Alkalinema sp. CAN_BIN05]|nr:hypothetical protein [Alkalinema sp. CAN_BIN05]
MIHSINTFDRKPSVKTPTEILDTDDLKANADVLDADILDADLIKTNSPISDGQSETIAQKHHQQLGQRQHAQQHSSIECAKRHLTATKTITVIPIEGALSTSQRTAGAIQSVVISANTPKSSQLTHYIVNSDDLSTYVQPYPSILFSAPSLSNGPRRVRSIRLPWLELGGGLAAFTIVSGVIVIDGLKQAKLSPSKPTAQLTSPKLTSISKSNPLRTSQMSVAELMNSGRSLPMANSAINFPTQQITSNPIATNSTLPKPTTLMSRRPIGMPETQVRGSQVLPAPRITVRTEPILQQPLPQSGLQQPPLNPSAFPPQEIPETPIVESLAPALPTTSANPADPLTYNRPDLIQVPTSPQNRSVSTSNVGR